MVRDDPAAAPRITLLHPHGIVCNAAVALCAGGRVWNAARRRRFGAPHFLVGSLLVAVWCTALARLVGLGWRISPASRASVAALMRAGKDLYLYPGGFVEAARHSYHADVVDVGSRGAIRLALEHGYAVRVGFAFGERTTAYNLHGPRGLWPLRFWLAKRGVPAVLPLLLPLAPTPTVAFSPTMRLPRLDAPTDADVERWHAAYVAALRAVHARFRSPGDVLAVHGLTASPRKSTAVGERSAVHPAPLHLRLNATHALAASAIPRLPGLADGSAGGKKTLCSPNEGFRGLN